MTDGARRYLNNRARGVVDRAIALHSTPEENDRMAKLAEDYFARRYGLDPDDDLRPKNAEFILAPPFGRRGEAGSPTTIDVKWTPYVTGHLIHRLDSRTHCTIYVLVIARSAEDEFRIAGWAWGHELRSSIMDLGHGPTYALPQSRLHRDIDERMAMLGFCRVDKDFQMPLFRDAG